MKIVALLLLAVALVAASSYYDQDPVEVTFPAQPPPLHLFGCTDTIAAGCGIATSCETIDDACNRAQQQGLVGVVKQCAQLKTKGGKLCVPDPGLNGVLPPLCNKVRQVKEHVYYCTDNFAYQCTAWCNSHCFEHDAVMVFLEGSTP